MSETFESELITQKNVIILMRDPVEDSETLLANLSTYFSGNFPELKEFICVLPLNYFAPWKQQDVIIYYIYLCKRDAHPKSFKIDEIFTSESVQLVADLDKIIFNNGKLFLTNKHTITVNFNFSAFTAYRNSLYTNETYNSFKLKELYILEPIHIPKPWGQEIWYTGVEKRGVSQIRTTGATKSLPIPYVLNSAPSVLLGKNFAQRQLVLVKILDPLPTPIFGDLYYELHTEKNEVYVVTQINAAAGKIKIGINSEKLNSYNNDIVKFKKEMLFAIKEYEVVRREIDVIFDEFRKKEHIALNEPISSERILQWSSQLPIELSNKEQEKRSVMESFTGFLDLQVTDVIQVPIFVPHALQHGVKVVEFQTPTYERYILSFAQKVLTQDHWDTEKALEIMQVTTPSKTILDVIHENASFKEELVCNFKEFKSTRLTINSQASFIFPQVDSYRILFHLSGSLSITIRENSEIKSQLHATEGQCIFIPAQLQVELKTNHKSISLICSPN